MGWVKGGHLDNAEVLVWMFLTWVKECLVTHWPLIQGGYGQDAVMKWYEIFLTFDLDLKAQADIMLLAQAGVAGRTRANKILWDLLTRWGLQPDFPMIRHKITNEVKWHRREFERPPSHHPDHRKWGWEKYDEVPKDLLPFSPKEVPPEGKYKIVVDKDTGLPLAPPKCWLVDKKDLKAIHKEMKDASLVSDGEEDLKGKGKGKGKRLGDVDKEAMKELEKQYGCA